MERHSIVVEASPPRSYAAARNVDMGNSRIIRSLFRVRGLPARLTIDDMTRLGFFVLGERPGEEFVLGVVGRFWTPTGQVRSVDPAAFTGFSEPNTAKAAWNFVVDPAVSGQGIGK